MSKKWTIEQRIRAQAIVVEAAMYKFLHLVDALPNTVTSTRYEYESRLKGAK